MYSSSPDVIKRFVPMHFSKQTLDFVQSPQKKFLPLDQNPFHNKKLRKNMDNKPKDFVLIFKNRSCKSFCAKKKIQFIPLLRNMKTAHQNCLVIKEASKNTYNLLIEKEPFGSTGLGRKPKTAHTRRSRETSNQPQIIATPFRSTRVSSLSKEGFRQKARQKFEGIGFDQKIGRYTDLKLYQTLRITGSKAPSSEIVEHWKKQSPSSPQFLRFLEGR